MNILGIDYGDKKIGLAIANGPLADPLKVLHYKKIQTAIKEIAKITREEKIEKIIIGISSGQIAYKSKKFASILEQETNLPVELVDETLSTQDAQNMAIQSGMKKKKRKALEDAFAATLILQSYLDSNEN